MPSGPSRVGAPLLSFMMMVAAAPGLAAADGVPSRANVRLVYHVAPGVTGCPTEAGIHHELELRLGYDPFNPDADEVLDLGIASTGPAFTVTATKYDKQHAVAWTKTVTGGDRSCERLFLGFSVALSFELDPRAASRAPRAKPEVAPLPGPPEPVAHPPVEPPPEPPPPAPPLTVAPPTATQPTATQPAPDRVTGEIEAGPQVTFGLSPGIAAGARVRAGARVGWLDAGGELWFDAPASGTVSAAPNASVQTFLLGGTLSVCAHAARYHVFGCVIAPIAWLHASEAGVPHGSGGAGPYLGAGTRFGLRLPIAGGFVADLHADVSATIVRPRAVVNELELWRAAPVVGSLGLGVVFPSF